MIIMDQVEYEIGTIIIADIDDFIEVAMEVIISSSNAAIDGEISDQDEHTGGLLSDKLDSVEANRLINSLDVFIELGPIRKDQDLLLEDLEVSDSEVSDDEELSF